MWFGGGERRPVEVSLTVQFILPLGNDGDQGKGKDDESVGYGAGAEHLSPVQRNSVDESFVGRGCLAYGLLLTRVSIRCDGKNWNATGRESLCSYLDAVSCVALRDNSPAK